jgi:hypothetical protein
MADLEVACPGMNPIGEYAYNLPFRASDESESVEVKTDEATSVKFESETVTGKFDHDMGMKTEMLPDHTSDQVFQVCFGERIKSFRALLKRPQTLFFLGGFNQTEANYLYLNAFPNNRRYYQWTENWATPNTASNVDLFSYLRGAFIGMRGGFRYSIFPYNHTGDLRALSANTYRGQDGDPSLFSPVSTLSVSVNHTGSHFALMSSNPALNFEVPYYETSRFVSSQGIKLKDYNIFPHSKDIQRIRLGFYSEDKADNTFTAQVTAVPADDFTFIGRVGAPPAITLWNI